MLTLIIAIVMALIGAVIVLRITEKPIRVGFQLTETGANTFSTTPLNLPTVPSIVLIRGRAGAKAIGTEVMKVIVDVTSPDQENDQTNLTAFELVKGQAPTALLQSENQRVIVRHQVKNDNSFTTSGKTSDFIREPTFLDLTDGDGNGEIVADNEIHVVVQGTGNAGAKGVRGYVLLHLVEIDATEALFELIETNA